MQSLPIYFKGLYGYEVTKKVSGIKIWKHKLAREVGGEQLHALPPPWLTFLFKKWACLSSHIPKKPTSRWGLHVIFVCFNENKNQSKHGITFNTCVSLELQVELPLVRKSQPRVFYFESRKIEHLIQFLGKVIQVQCIPMFNEVLGISCPSSDPSTTVK